MPFSDGLYRTASRKQAKIKTARLINQAAPFFNDSATGDKKWANRTEPNRTEPNRTEPNRTEIIHTQENNFNENNLLKLKTLFPEAFCENKIDWEKLKLILGAENSADNGERYRLDWAGKTAAYHALQTPTFNTLIPCREESVDFDTTHNVFIEAENMEALKILQKAYAGSVKMIYIDPPYNTGNDSFIYPDKFSESREEYARRVGDKNDEGYLKRDGVFQGAWRKNGKDCGHYHSNWLSMMLPRLHLAKTLLREDGVIFISIDDNEQAQLKLLCDEVFGAENFVGQITWHRKRGKDNSAPNLSRVHEYLFVYAKNIQDIQFNRLEIEAETLKAYKNPDNDERGKYRVLGLWARGNQGGSRYEYTTQKGTYYSEREWLVGFETMQKLDAEKRLIENGDKLYRKLFLSEVAGSVSETIWLNASNTANAADELKQLFDKKSYFETPKPIPYLVKMTKLATHSNDLILDFFSGSGTTAHAVMQLNAEDGGRRRYICVQLPEETDEKSEARKAGFSTIAEIAKERIRRAGVQIRRVHLDAPQAEKKATTENGATSCTLLDTGFKVFKLTESAFKQWRNPESRDAAGLKEQLEIFRDVVKSDASTEHMTYELALRLGFQLTDPIVFSDGMVWLNDETGSRKTALLLETVNDALLSEVLAQQPVKVFALDKAFGGDDALKANAALQCQDADVAFETL